MFSLKVALVALAVFTASVAAHAMGRHYVAEALASTVDVVAVPETTQGPYFEAESDYVVGSDMTAAAKAGFSSAITTDRVAVTQAVALTITLNIWNVTNGGTEVFPLVGADVFLWHCDALGRYSAVPQSEQRSEGTTGQQWLRGKQTTPTNGSVTFRTILAGWYTGRTIHYHVRVRLAGASSTSFASTTQLFLNQTFISSYSSVYPYTQDTQELQLLATDMVYTGVSASVRPKLLLNATGSNSAGYVTTFNLGIDTSATSSSASSGNGSAPAMPPNASSSGSTPPLPPNASSSGSTPPLPPNASSSGSLPPLPPNASSSGSLPPLPPNASSSGSMPPNADTTTATIPGSGATPIPATNTTAASAVATMTTTTAAPATVSGSATTETSSDDHTNTGAVVGGCVTAILCVAAAVVFVVRTRNARDGPGKKAPADVEMSNSTSAPLTAMGHQLQVRNNIL